MAERVQSGPQQSRARRCSGAAQRTLDGEDRSERITGGRKGSLIPAYSPTKIPEFPIFSLPATVLATSPARAAMSTKLILGGAGRELWEAALSPGCWAKVKQPNSKH